MKDEKNKILYSIIAFVVLVAVLFGVTYFLKKDTDDGTESIALPEVISFVADDNDFIIEVKNTSKVYVYGIPTGTEVGTDESLQLGKANLAEESDQAKTIRIAIPKDPMLLSNVYAVAENTLGQKSERFYFALIGASNIYNALWANIPTTVETISVGQEIIASGLNIVLEKVEDSRCPSNVVCVQKGDAKVYLSVSGLGKKGNLILDTTENKEARFAGFSIILDSVNPYPNTAGQIEQSEYVVTLIIEQQSKS